MPESSLKNWDALLRDGLVKPPADFSARVIAQVEQMAHIARMADTADAPGLVQQGQSRRQTVAHGLAILGAAMAGLAGLSQLALFSFGIWQATAAG